MSVKIQRILKGVSLLIKHKEQYYDGSFVIQYDNTLFLEQKLTTFLKSLHLFLLTDYHATFSVYAVALDTPQQPIYGFHCDHCLPWASYQIRKIAGCACAGNAGNVFPRRRFQNKPLVNDPDMHHGTCVTHVP